MSENAVTFDAIRVTVSDMSPERSNESVPRVERSRKVQSGTRKPAYSESKAASLAASSNISTPSVTFVVDQNSGKSFIQVVDRNSGEILRQIPPEEARRLSAALKEMIGNVIDTVA